MELNWIEYNYQGIWGSFTEWGEPYGSPIAFPNSKMIMPPYLLLNLAINFRVFHIYYDSTSHLLHSVSGPHKSNPHTKYFCISCSIPKCHIISNTNVISTVAFYKRDLDVTDHTCSIK